MRALVLLVAVLGSTGCCVLEAAAFPQSCVQEPAGRCVDLLVDTCSDDPAPPSPYCGATVRDATCEDLGYTKACSAYLVRPDAQC